ncbi:hypothetical protein HNP49_002540 [Pseudomonas fluvialis]|uniref:Lipoprotein n=1 Tax=Pseudomonas fluvialis TaxID=1793966 RepID=A0A7X0BTN5_9PSED|nr:hypothetical protein [Pseudomonas fluvialis]MBB6342358.1 hypothetical protein [Pseudomonas fluvialis]
MRTTLLATALLLASAAAHAGYALNETVRPCDEHTYNPSGLADIHDCRIPGTQRFINRKVREPETGRIMVERAHGYATIKCDESNTCAIYGTPGFDGEYIGDAPTGYYQVTYGWYIGTDASGKAVAYRVGTGPQHGAPPYNPLLAEEDPEAPYSDPDETPVAPGSHLFDE